MERHRLLIATGLLVVVGSVLLWFALGGFQLPGYGGMTAEQDAATDRANTIAVPLFVLGLLTTAVGINAAVGHGKSRRPR
jgi:uncharacterized membrane protein